MPCLTRRHRVCCLQLPGNKLQLQLILLNPSCEQFQGPMVTSTTSSYSLPLLLWADYWPCVPGQGRFHMRTENRVSPGNVPWWPRNMAIFPLWFYLHPRRGPCWEQRKLVLVLSALLRMELPLLPLSSSHFQECVTHGPILARPPGPMESVIIKHPLQWDHSPAVQ